MNDFGPTNPHESPFRPRQSEHDLRAVGCWKFSGAGAAPAPPPAFSPNWSAPVLTANTLAGQRYGGYWRTGRAGRIGGRGARVRGESGSMSAWPRPPSATAAPLVADPAPGHQRSVGAGPRWGIGHGRQVSKSSFTMTTSAGQKVTVDEKSSTKYEKGTSSTSAKAVTKGESVLALGTVNSTTITATQVVVGYKRASSAVSTAKVVPFAKGEATTSKQVGQSRPTGAPVGDDRQRDNGEQGDRSGAGRLPGGHRRPCG